MRQVEKKDIKLSSSFVPTLTIYLSISSDWIKRRKIVARTDKFLPQYMRMFDQASHSICPICTCNHEIVIFNDTSSLAMFLATIILRKHSLRLCIFKVDSFKWGFCTKIVKICISHHLVSR